MSLQPQRIARQIAAAVAVAAFAAPVALGADLRSPDTRDAAAAVREAAAQLDLRSPDTRDRAWAIRIASASAGDVRSPDTQDRAAGDFLPGSTGTITLTMHRAGGFDWYDATIGAAAGAGLILLLVGTWLAVRHARTEPRPA